MEHYFIDRYSGLNSFIHRLDARVKFVTVILFILFVVLNPDDNFISLFAFGILILSLILLSKVPLRYILGRLLTILPFILVIAIFIPFANKGEILKTFSIGNYEFAIRDKSLLIFLNIILKALLASLAVILLSTATKFSHLLKALERLEVPKIIIMILSFMYRYLFVLIDEILKTKRAKTSRTIYIKRWHNMKSLANIIGTLFIRAYERAERVYMALCARGFEGEIKTMERLQLKAADFIFSSVFITSLILIGVFCK